ncbi:MAG: hypothetical protein FWC45_00590 [Treponema sp.]|nr:hypothetical protein [Treponema sp.]
MIPTGTGRLRKKRLSLPGCGSGAAAVPELMILAARNPQAAESSMAQFCAEFEGSPEVTDEGTVVYRFDEILLSGEKNDAWHDQDFAKQAAGASAAGIPSPLFKKLKTFSFNPKKMNFWFGLINGVNLLFGSYFLYNAVNIGRIMNEAQLQGSGIYGIVYYVLYQITPEPLSVIKIALGIIPLLFSLLFWLIPAVRAWLLQKENDSLRMDNFRSLFYGRIWTNPEKFIPAALEPADKDCRPGNIQAAREKALKEMVTYSVPDVSRDDKQNEVFDFPELRREKDALEKYRLSLDPARAKPGKTVFDTHASSAAPEA